MIEKEKIKLILTEDYISNICQFDSQCQIYIIKPEIGIVTLTIYSPDFKTSYISSLYVKEEFRNLGIGNKLIKFCIDISKALKCDIVTLDVEVDTFMHKWYNRCGFIDYKTSDNLIELIKVLPI